MSRKVSMKWGVFLVLFFLFSACTPKDDPPLPAEEVEEHFSPESLVRFGKNIIFGTDQPVLNSSGRLPVGKGQCAFCHLFVANQKTDRCPDLRNVEARSHQRPKEDRYRSFVREYADSGEPKTGIRPHAVSGGEYLIESLYCPSCYMPEGLGEKGAVGMKSPMPIITNPPMALSDYEIVSVVAYLQEKDTPGDYTQVTAKQDWEHYFGKALPPPEEEPAGFPGNEEALKRTALVMDTPDVMIEKMGCFVCHKIPSVSIARIGVIGPLLILKTTAQKRIASPEYQEAVRAGKAKATTPKEYVLESIMHPGAFVVEGFSDGMPTDYPKKFTVGALEKLVDFLLTLDEELAMKEERERFGEEELEEEEERDERTGSPRGAKEERDERAGSLPGRQ
ncbi:MAG: hypothetical protein ABGX83_08115 [Nitrospira sp.]|nr:hypothetical protein [Candidatus Manganitrophaceae bacterium]HIL35316.1 hypothetical protein [Candidatus Manganitrophaceae bacterium]